ncbi:MAG TPA: hypothetical protein ENN12_03895, partial [Epsilonproteobacteria bacterium]|nr:hypothetical protein [Campylobacterota bacterium]
MKKTKGLMAFVLVSVLTVATYGGFIESSKKHFDEVKERAGAIFGVNNEPKERDNIKPINGIIQGDTKELEASKMEDNGVYRNAGNSTTVSLKVGGGTNTDNSKSVQSPLPSSLQFFNAKGDLYRANPLVNPSFEAQRFYDTVGYHSIE